jgi:hypothetical protein
MDTTRARGKTSLRRSEERPLCPWCGTPLTRIMWHKIRGGPLIPYTIVLSCDRCRAVLDCLTGSTHHHVP